MWSKLAMLFLIGCHAQPVEQATIPIAIVAWPSQIKPSCEFPILPNPVVIVGFPDSEKIYVTRRDLEGLVQYQAEMLAWSEAVTRCFGKLSQ